MSSEFDSAWSATVTKANDAAAIAFRGPASGSGRKVQSRPALLCQSFARFAAGIGFPIELLRNGRRPTNVAQSQNLDLEVSALCFDPEKIADPYFARRAGELMVGFDPAQFTRLRGERARLEEPRGPKPFVETDADHFSIVAVEYASDGTKGSSSQWENREPQGAKVRRNS